MSALSTVYLHLGGAVAATGVAAAYPVIPQKVWLAILQWILIFAISFGIMFMKPGPLKYVVFALYIFLLGNSIRPFAEMLDQQDVLMKTLAMTTGMFLAMTALAFAFPGRFLGFGPYLFAALLGLILGRIGVWIAGLADAPQEDLKKTSTILSYFGVILFSLYVVYDSQVLKTRMGARLIKKDPINATIGLYLDILNLFLNLGDILSD